MRTAAVITKTEAGWQVDWRENELTIKTSLHSSKTKALASIANKTPGISQLLLLVGIEPFSNLGNELVSPRVGKDTGETQGA